MRRCDREVSDINKIESIIASARYMHLGMFDEKFPYVVPLHYGYLMEDGKLTFYIHSAKEGHKLECLKRNNNVFVEIDRGESLIASDIPCEYSAEYESVMCRGKAEIIENPVEKCKALELLMKVQTGSEYAVAEKMADAVAIIKIDVESYTAKVRAR